MHIPPHASRTHRRRIAALLASALLTALILEGALARQAKACGGPEIDYGPEGVVVKTQGRRSEVRLNFRRQEYSFAGGNLNLSEVRIYTRDRRFVAWLKQHGMSKQTWAQVQAVGKRHHCSTLLEGTQILRLERQLATALTRAYRKATRRHTPRPDVMLLSAVLDQSDPTCHP